LKPSAYVALPQAARRLGVSLERAIGMIHESQLRAKLSGGRWWIERQSLEALLRARRRGSGGQAA
jgi:hypothetical protein